MPNNNYCQKLRELTPKVKKLKELIETYKQEGKEETYQEADEILKEVEGFAEVVVEKSVKELKKLWEENEEEMNEISEESYEDIFPFISSLLFLEAFPFLLERISNQFLKKFDLERFKEREDIEHDLPLFLSAFLNKNIENYVISQKDQGLKEEEIKPIEVHLKVKETPVVFSYLGWQNPEKLHLFVEGDCNYELGFKMQGGKIVVEGNCGDSVGDEMQNGEIIVEGNCENEVGWEMQNGKIIIKGNCGEGTGHGMKGGKIIVEGNCGWRTGEEMQGGKLIIKGDVEIFDDSAFSPKNQGTIIWKGIKIWEKGSWTKEGKDMKEKDEIPFSFN